MIEYVMQSVMIVIFMAAIIFHVAIYIWEGIRPLIRFSKDWRHNC